MRLKYPTDHYHFPPSCLETQIGKLSDGHSPLLGWALDGFPIYGPFGPGGVVMAHTSQGCSGSYCLDECSGLELEISGLDDFKYRYYFNGPLSDLVSLPTDPKPATTDYPFAFKCYKGCTYAQLTAGDTRCTGGSSGVTSSYTAAATAGVTAIYESSAATAAGMQCASTGSSSSSSSNTTTTSPATSESTAASPAPALPPPASPPPPVTTIQSAFAASGAVSDYDDSKKNGIAAVIANASSVDFSAVTVTVTAGSVNIATIVIIDAALAATTANTLATGIFASTAALSTALANAGVSGVTISAITSAPTVVDIVATDNDNLGGIIGGAVGGSTGLIFGLFGYYMYTKKKKGMVKSAAPTVV